MNDSHEQPRSADEDAALDRLLTAAEWPEVDKVAMRRLVKAVSLRRRSPNRWWMWPAAAAAVVTMAGIVWLTGPNAGPAKSQPSVVAMRPPDVSRLTRPAPHAGGTPTPAPIGRPATIAEQMWLRTASRVTPKPVDSHTPPSPTVARALSDPDEHAGVVRFARASLARSTRNADTSADLDMAARLAAVALPADWPLVRAYLTKLPTRQTTLAALIARKDDAAVGLLLRGVLDASLRPAVLAALKESPGLPPSALLAKFDSPRMDERWAAAVALGRTADVGTLDRLADMVERDEHRRESIAALVASDAPAARVLLVRVSQMREAAPHVAPAREAVAVLLVREASPRYFPNVRS